MNQIDDWKSLHRDHVSGLVESYNQIFRRFPKVDSIVIHSGRSALKYSGDDQYWPRARTPHFLHWTPYQSTPALLLLTAGQKPQLIVERHTSYWEAPLAENTCWDEESFEISSVDTLNDADVRGSCVYIGDERVSLPRMISADSFYEEVLLALNNLRTQKSTYEIACMREATRLALAGHARLRHIFESMEPVSELSLHYEYLRVTQQTEAELPYSDIIALGAHAAILHHIHYESKAYTGDLSLLVDAGAQFNGYASDITRTWVRGVSHGANKFRELISGVEAVQQSLCAGFKVGTAYEDLHNHSHELLADVIRRVGLTTASQEELVSSGATRCLFPHGLGHSLGLQVHDVGMRLVRPSDENPYLRNTSQIVPGNVVTVEPGIYFIDSLLQKLKGLRVSTTFQWDLINLLKPFGGVRIEDNLLATVDGPVNLTREFGG